jgi:hypothetical protein
VSDLRPRFLLGGMGYQHVRDAVLTHPTMGEGLNLLFDALDDQLPTGPGRPTLEQVPNG